MFVEFKVGGAHSKLLKAQQAKGDPFVGKIDISETTNLNPIVSQNFTSK